MNTNQGKRMEDGKIEMTYCGKLIQAPGSVGWICCEGNRACPSCLRAHIAKQDAELAALRGQVGVVVPEIDPAIDRQISEYLSAISSQGSMELVSSSRVAGEGEVVVPALEWAAMSAIGYDPEPCRHDHHGYCQEHGWFSLEPCPTGIMQRIRAAREAE